MHWVPVALTSEAFMHAMIAFAGFNLWFKQKCFKQDQEVKRYQAQAEYHLYQGIRLLNQNLKHPKEALSNASIITAQFLGSCTVRHNFRLLVPCKLLPCIC